MVVLTFFRLIRLPILLLIAAIQYLMRWCILEPMFRLNGFEFIISESQFALLVLSSVLVAAGGYAINDYFDAKIDRINKPKRVLVNRLIKRRVAMATHVVLSSLGMLIAAYVSWRLGVWQLSVIYFFVSFCLWFYSTTFQHQFLVGNVIIALMAAFVPLTVGLYEIPLQNQANVDLIRQYGFSVFNTPAFWVIGYAVVLFILTLAREITKDVVDMKGDRVFGAKTIPITLGVTKSKWILSLVYAILGLVVTWYFLNFLVDHTGITPLFLLIVGAIVFQFILIFRAKTKKQFKISANFNNLITVLVLLSALLVRFSIENHFQ